MDKKDFDHLLSNSSLIGKEKAEAWQLYKEKGSEEALIFARGIEEHMSSLRQSTRLRNTPVPYQVWGKEFIEDGALKQMFRAAHLPIAVAGALMPDAHQGYGLPIGGVLATENAVIPYAVGVDIACRMMLSVYPTSPDVLRQTDSASWLRLKDALVNNTVFGSGLDGIHDGRIEHPILEESRWRSTPLIKSLRETAIRQIGTSGGGNHFVEWGEFEVLDHNNPLKLAIGRYLALLSHSGSRGVGFKIANYYTKLATDQTPNLDKSVQHLAWLPLDSEAGQEYWEAMELAGEFASANHHIIHERIAREASLESLATIENHHNFAWKEKIVIGETVKEVIVHRKGATPAGLGVLGIIPGTMADKGYVVVGKGNAESFNSASHGSGRQMSRSAAKNKITEQQHTDYLAEHGVTLIGGGLDESPQAYKPIQSVIKAQQDLVSVIGTFQPRIVRMATDLPPMQRKATPKGIIDAESD